MSTDANPDVYGFRWGSDVTDANTPSFLEVMDASREILQSDLDATVFFIYVGIENDGDMSASSAFHLQHDSGSAAWVNVTTTSTFVRTIAGQDADLDAITGLPSGFNAGAGTFTNGEYSDATASETDVNVGGGLYSVHVYSIEFQSADLSGGETVEFRLTHGGVAMTNDVVPTCTIEAAGSALLMPPFYQRGGFRDNVLLRM